MDRAQQRLGMQHADDVVGLAAPERQARMRACQHRLDDLLRRLVGIDGGEIAAMDHDVADDDVVEIEDRMQHGAGFLFLAARLGMEIDGAAQLRLRLVRAQVGGDIGAQSRSMPRTKHWMTRMSGRSDADDACMIGATASARRSALLMA